MGLPQTDLDALLRGRWDESVSVDHLTRCLTRLGVSVVWTFEDEPDWREGHLVVNG